MTIYLNKSLINICNIMWYIIIKLTLVYKSLYKILKENKWLKLSFSFMKTFSLKFKTKIMAIGNSFFRQLGVKVLKLIEIESKQQKKW